MGVDKTQKRLRKASGRVGVATSVEFLRIAVVMPLGSQNAARTMRGVTRFARPERRWAFRFDALAQDMPNLLRWRPNGVLAWLQSEDQLQRLLELDCPIVSTNTRLRHPRVGIVAPDAYEAGRLAARHLLDRGLRHFGFFGARDLQISVERRQGFTDELERAGYAPRVMLGDDDGFHGSSGRSWRQTEKDLGDWLCSLPKPAGVLGWRDVMAFLLAETCLERGLKVPGEIALIGVDNDSTFCDLAYPPLSSVSMPFEEIGYQAAALLERMMRGAAAPAEPLLLPPHSVIPRNSTDTVAVDDPLVRQSLAIIRSQAGNCLSVKSMLQKLGVSRRLLENRFQSVLGRTPFDEIRRARLELAKSLLEKAELSIGEVARSSGFPSARSLCETLRAHTGLKPSQYRHRLQIGDGR